MLILINKTKATQENGKDTLNIIEKYQFYNIALAPQENTLVENFE